MTQHVHVGTAVHGGGPTVQQYAPTTQQPSHGGGGSTIGLPFTGLDVVAMCLVAGGLAASGLVLQRLSRPRR